MAKDIVIRLEQLRCIALENTEERTEPYIWPALIRVDDNTLATPALLSIFTPILEHARVVIKDSMRAGETAPIPDTVGVLRARFEDDLDVRRLILVVAMLEMDSTPQSAMKAGYQAFSRELAAAIAENLLALSSAGEEEEKQIVDEIKKRVEREVRSAIADGLSAYEKVKVAANLLNLDDAIGSAFRTFSPRGPVADPLFVAGTTPDRENLEPGPFTLTFEAKAKVLGLIDTLSQYEIQGQLQVRPVVVDRCQAQIEAVIAAKGFVDSIEAEIASLQDELQQAATFEKPFLISEIKRLKTEELPLAIAELEDARRALEACRSFRPPVADPSVVITDLVASAESQGDGHGQPRRHGSTSSTRRPLRPLSS